MQTETITTKRQGRGKMKDLTPTPQISFSEAGLPGFRVSIRTPKRFSISSTNLLPPVSLLLLVA
jgi:hypothetical protein